MIAWALCCTDQGQHEPTPMVKHCFSSEDEARKYWQRYWRSDPHHPIRKVSIEILEETENDQT